MNLKRLARGSRGDFGREKLGFGSQTLIGQALLLQLRRVIDKQPGGIDFGCHVGQFPLNRLELGNRLAKLPPLLGIANRCLQGGPGNPGRKRADADSSSIQNLERVRIATVEPAEQILFGHPNLFQTELRSIRSSHPKLIFDSHDLEPRSLSLHDERRDSTCATLGFRGSHDHVDTRNGTLSNVELVTTENPLLTNTPSKTLKILRSRTRLRFGQSPRA